MNEALKCIYERLDMFELRINELLSVFQMDTCESLLSDEDFRYFCGNIKDDYLNLVSGLDDQSIYTINRILTRIQNYWNEKTSFFWFTESEKKELVAILDSHFSKTVKLSDDCFAYGQYFLPANIITTSVFFYDHFLGEVQHLERIKCRNIIDAGGFIGDSAIILSKYTDNTVHVFEPVTYLCEMVKRTIKLNCLKDIVVNQFGLGDSEENRMINLACDSSTFCNTHRLNEKTCKQEACQVIKLDTYVARKNLDVGLIKVDVDGFEQPLLRGAEKTIKMQKPTLLLSIYHNADDFFHIKTLLESWNLGYKFKIRKPSDRSIIVDTILIAEIR